MNHETKLIKELESLEVPIERKVINFNSNLKRLLEEMIKF